MTTKIKIIIEENGKLVMGEGVELGPLDQSIKERIVAHMVNELAKIIQSSSMMRL